MPPDSDSLVTQQTLLKRKGCRAAASNTHIASVEYETHSHAGAEASLAALAGRGLHDDAVVWHVAGAHDRHAHLAMGNT
jgi:hypothetical protein